jgi:hypothetical protein
MLELHNYYSLQVGLFFGFWVVGLFSRDIVRIRVLCSLLSQSIVLI